MAGRGANYWKKEAQKNKNSKKYAWGQYFQMANDRFDNYVNIVETMENQPATIEEQTQGCGEHLKNFIQKLYKDSKEKIECPICLERIIEHEDLDTQRCGHNFHKDCFEGLCQANQAKRFVDCPLCRAKIWNKHH